MASVLQPIYFSNSVKEIVWTAGSGQVTAYLWGAGGGGGGYDSGAPGTGSGGGYSRKTFSVNTGDVITVAVGGPGSAGSSGASGYGGGPAGPSFLSTWSTLALTGAPYIRVTNPAWSNFLNTYGVWNYSSTTTTFDNTVSVKFLQTGYYTVTGSCDNYGTVYVDGNPVLSMPGYQSSYSDTIYVTEGTHSVRILGTNTGGPGGVAVTFTSNSGDFSFSGGRGGNAGGAGSSGGGGGGGGASVILLNNSVIAVAGGGGGGGGGGNRNPSTGQSDPGTSGQTSTGVYAGQNGQDISGDGGGGGGGGGGYAGGNGGAQGPGYDTGGLAGYYGASLGDVVEYASGQVPGGITSPYFVSGIAAGGARAAAGSNGYAVLDMNIGAASVKYNGAWNSVKNSWIKYQGSWTPIKSTWVKTGGVWQPVGGGSAPAVTTLDGYWGVLSRGF